MMNEINCGPAFHERIVLKKDDGEMLAYVPERTCKNLYWYGDAARFWCSNCDFKSNWPISKGRSARPNFCPNCGAEVVSE